MLQHNRRYYIVLGPSDFIHVCMKKYVYIYICLYRTFIHIHRYIHKNRYTSAINEHASIHVYIYIYTYVQTDIFILHMLTWWCKNSDDAGRMLSYPDHMGLNHIVPRGTINLLAQWAPTCLSRECHYSSTSLFWLQTSHLLMLRCCAAQILEPAAP